MRTSLHANSPIGVCHLSKVLKGDFLAVAYAYELHGLRCARKNISEYHVFYTLWRITAVGDDDSPNVWML